MKSNIIYLFTTIALTFGLTSCSSDGSGENGTKYKKLKEPTIIKPTGSISWNTFRISTDRKLNINDAIEFENEPRGNLRVTTQCRIGSQNIKFDFNSSLRSRFRIFEFLGEGIIELLNSKNEINCTFDFVANYEPNTKHIFGLQSIQVNDMDPSSLVRLEGTSQKSSLDQPVVKTNDAESKIHLQGEAADKLRLSCADFYTELATTNSTISFSDFNLKNPTFLRDPATASSRLLQSCRIFAYSQEKMVGASLSFVLLQAEHLPRTEDLFSPGWDEVRDEKNKFNPIYSITLIKNPNVQPVKLKIPKFGPDFKFHVVTSNGLTLNHDSFGQGMYPGKSWFTLPKDVEIESETESEWTVVLKPNEPLQLSLYAKIEGYKCRLVAAQTGSASKPNIWIDLVENVNGETITIPAISIFTDAPQNLGWGSTVSFLARHYHEGKARCTKP